jgi:O-antigen/teichoic acid export membrane protein
LTSDQPTRRLSAERLREATIWRLTYLLLQGGTSLLLYALLAHVLPAHQFAAAAVAQGVLVISQAVGELGLSQAAVAILPGQLAADPDSEAELLGGCAAAFALAALPAVALALLAALAVPSSARLAVALMAPAAAAIVVVSGADGLLRSVGEFRRPALLVTVSGLGSYVSLATAAGGGSAAATTATMSAGTVLASLPAAAVLMNRYRAARQPRPGPIIKAAAPLALSQLFVIAGGRINTVLLAGLVSTSVAAGFESAWRLYQLSLYLAGGLATAAAPFIADAVGRRSGPEFARLVRRLLGASACAGTVLAAGVLIARRPLADVVFGHLGARVAHSLLPLLIVTPLAFAGFVATYTLATSTRDRWPILWANLAGAVVNVALIYALAPSHGLLGATSGCAAGILVTQVLLLARVAPLLRASTQLTTQTPKSGYK